MAENTTKTRAFGSGPVGHFFFKPMDQDTGAGAGGGVVDADAKAAADAAAAEAAAKASTDKAAADAAAAEAEADKQAGGVVTGGGRNITIPQKAMQQIKAAAERRGQRRALEALAKENGCTVDELQARLKPAPVTQQQQAPKPAVEQHDQQQGRPKSDKQLAQALRERDELAKRASNESRAARRARQELEDLQAEMAFRQMFVGAGVREVDIALDLMRRTTENMSDEQLVAFDEKKQIEEWRKTKPFLFGEISRPANTGPGAGAPPAPSPGDKVREGAENGKLDLMKASPTEVREYLRLSGINPDIAMK